MERIENPHLAVSEKLWLSTPFCKLFPIVSPSNHGLGVPGFGFRATPIVPASVSFRGNMACCTYAWLDRVKSHEAWHILVESTTSMPRDIVPI